MRMLAISSRHSFHRPHLAGWLWRTTQGKKSASAQEVIVSVCDYIPRTLMTMNGKQHHLHKYMFAYVHTYASANKNLNNISIDVSLCKEKHVSPSDFGAMITVAVLVILVLGNGAVFAAFAAAFGAAAAFRWEARAGVAMGRGASAPEQLCSFDHYQIITRWCLTALDDQKNINH